MNYPSSVARRTQSAQFQRHLHRLFDQMELFPPSPRMKVLHQRIRTTHSSLVFIQV